MTARGLSRPERALLDHVIQWGSDGYPLHKVGSRHWAWDFQVEQGGPTSGRVYPTKREATASLEAFLDVLCDAAAGRI
jgi:hypothetical protein